MQGCCWCCSKTGFPVFSGSKGSRVGTCLVTWSAPPGLGAGAACGRSMSALLLTELRFCEAGREVPAAWNLFDSSGARQERRVFCRAGKPENLAGSPDLHVMCALHAPSWGT